MKFVRIEVRLSGLLNEAIELDSRSYRGNNKHRLLGFVTFLSSGSERGGCAVVRPKLHWEVFLRTAYLIEF